MKNFLSCMFAFVFIMTLPACGKTDQLSADLEAAEEQIDSLLLQLDEAQENIDRLEEELNDTNTELGNYRNSLRGKEETLEMIYKFGAQAVMPGQFRMPGVALKLDMQQGISCLDPDDPEAEIRIYDIPTFSNGVYTVISPGYYFDILAKVCTSYYLNGDVYEDESNWYLVAGPGFADTGSVYWIPEANVKEYTHENMYEVNCVHLSKGAPYSLSENMSTLKYFDNEYRYEYDIGVMEQYDTGVSKVSSEGSVFYVYTKDLVYPEPLK